MEFLECEDNEFLLSFYTQNHFKPFDTRITASQKNLTPLYKPASSRLLFLARPGSLHITCYP